MKTRTLIHLHQTPIKGVVRGVCKKIYVSQDFPLMPAPEREVQACFTLSTLPRSPPALNQNNKQR